MKSSKAVILAVMDAIAKIAFITARIIALLDFISAVQYMIHFIYHFVHLQLYKVALNAHHIILCFLWCR